MNLYLADAWLTFAQFVYQTRSAANFRKLTHLQDNKGWTNMSFEYREYGNKVSYKTINYISRSAYMTGGLIKHFLI